MKLLTGFVIAFFLLLFLTVGCNSSNVSGQLGQYGVNVNVVIIDSCEYVVAEEYQRAISIVHKQNCRFCAERNRSFTRWDPGTHTAPYLSADSTVFITIDTTNISYHQN